MRSAEYLSDTPQSWEKIAPLTPHELFIILQQPDLRAYLEAQPGTTLVRILCAVIQDTTIATLLASKLAEDEALVSLNLQFAKAWEEIVANEILDEQ